MIKKIILERELVSNECEEGIRRIENLQIIDENGPKPYDPNYSFKYGYLEDNIDSYNEMIDLISKDFGVPKKIIK